MGKYKILMTYVEAGMGHIISAEAIANALEKYYPDEVEVVRCKFFTDTGDPALEKHEQFLINEVKKSNRHPLHMFYMSIIRLKHFPHLATIRIAYGIIFGKVNRHSRALFRKYDPDMVFSTHFTPLHLSIEEKRDKKGADFLTAVYDPDPNVHGWWDRRADLAIFNNPFAYREAVDVMRFKPENSVLGTFVIRDVVRATPKDKTVLRKKHDLPENQFTITIASGAYAEGHLPAFAERLLQIDRPFTLLIIAGSNDEVYNHFSEKVGHTGKVDLRVYHFVPDAHELYGASDIFLTKAGPNAILDSVYMGTPVMTIFYASLIEKITKQLYIDENKVGVHLTDPEEAATFLTDCMEDPAKLAPYVENCRTFVEKQTGGEKQIADAIVEKLRRNGPPKADRNAANTPEPPKKRESEPSLR